MKKMYAVLAIALAVFIIVPIISHAQTAFTPPAGAQYGVTVDGIYFISADLVKAANGAVPKIMSAATNFKSEVMRLDGNYYIYASGRQIRTDRNTDFCFDIGNGKYLPHALINDARIKAGDAVDNGVGGYNFRMLPK